MGATFVGGAPTGGVATARRGEKSVGVSPPCSIRLPCHAVAAVAACNSLLAAVCASSAGWPPFRRMQVLGRMKRLFSPWDEKYLEEETILTFYERR